jgi:integrase
MPAKVLTARAVEAARPKRNAKGELVRNEIPDAGCLGLYLVVEPTGTRSWAHRFRDNGTPRKVTLGSAAELTLAAARHRVAGARHRLERGKPAAPITSPAPTGGDSIEAAVASFLQRHAYAKTRRNSAAMTEYAFNRYVLPAWRGRPVTSIRRSDVLTLIEDVAADAPYSANRLLAALSKFFNWLCSRDVIGVAPTLGVPRPHKEKARERVLDDGELRALWLACEGEGAFGAALRLMILTGARRNEVSRLTRDEIDPDRQEWRLPAERSKNHRAHTIPLSTQAAKLLQAQPEFVDCPYAFTTNARTPVVGWPKLKRRLSGKAGLDPASWRLHDIRRSVASGLQRLHVRTEVIERALNHRGGLYRGIVGVYQVDPLAAEVRAGLQAWSDHVERAVGGKPAAKIVKLRRR